MDLLRGGNIDISRAHTSFGTDDRAHLERVKLEIKAFVSDNDPKIRQLGGPSITSQESPAHNVKDTKKAQQRQHISQAIECSFRILSDQLGVETPGNHQGHIERTDELYTAVTCIEDSTWRSAPFVWLWM